MADMPLPPPVSSSSTAPATSVMSYTTDEHGNRLATQTVSSSDVISTPNPTIVPSTTSSTSQPVAPRAAPPSAPPQSSVWDCSPTELLDFLSKARVVATVNALYPPTSLAPPQDPPPESTELAIRKSRTLAAIASTLTDATLASNLIATFQSALGPDKYACLGPAEARGSKAKHTVAGLACRATLNSLVNAIAVVEGGVIAMDDSSVAKTNKDAPSTCCPSTGVVIPKKLQEIARVLRRTIAARVEADQLSTTPARIRDMLCPELPTDEVVQLKQRVRDTVLHGMGTHSSAKVKEREAKAKAEYTPVIHKASEAEMSGLNGDPNNLGGLQRCANCAKHCVEDWHQSRTDDEKANIMFKPQSYWKEKVGGQVASWCKSNWSKWSLQQPPFFALDWGDTDKASADKKRLADYMRKKGLFFVEHCPDEFIPVEHFNRLGGAQRTKKQVNDQNGARFTVDRKNGDAICVDCGIVARENIMHEGEQYRKFADSEKEDRNHHGQAKNKLLSDSFNMSTSLSKNNFGQTGGFGRGAAGWGGARGGGNLETVLANAHSYTEMNLSTFGRSEKGATRETYKDLHKLDAFREINQVGDALNLHPVVIQRSHELFAGFRDDREILQKFKGILAGCIWLAFDEIAEEGKQILAITAGDVQKGDESQRAKAGSAAACRRDGLHTAKVATVVTSTDVSRMFLKGADGKGGVDGAEVENDRMSEVAIKPMHSWDLDDIRDWLIKACMDIAAKQDELVPQLKAEIEQKEELDRHSKAEFEAVLGDYLKNAGWTKQGDSAYYSQGYSAGNTGLLDTDWFSDKRRLVKFVIDQESGSQSSAALQPVHNLLDTLDEARSGMQKAAQLRKKLEECIQEDDKEVLEGILVEKAMALCEKLEEEVDESTAAKAPSSSRTATGRVSTVMGMGNLGINWQGKDERGGGGAGGVGNNSRNNIGGVVSRGNGKTPGQILMLKTSKKIIDVVEDVKVGKIIHTALENMKVKQKDLKRKRSGNESAQKRVNQMKRKAYFHVKGK